jgi:hypothetical protein
MIYVHPYCGILTLWSYCSSARGFSVPAEVNPVLAGYFSRTATALMSKYKTEAPKRSGAHHAPVVYSGLVGPDMDERWCAGAHSQVIVGTHLRR